MHSRQVTLTRKEDKLPPFRSKKCLEQFGQALEEAKEAAQVEEETTKGPILGPKVVWLQTFSRKNGGGELSSLHVIDVGKKLGFDIETMHPDNLQSRKIIKSHFVVVNGLAQFPDTQQGEIIDALVEQEVPYVVYDHVPFEGKDNQRYLALFGRSKLNVFISPLHYKLRQEQFKSFLEPSTVLLLAIDPSIYKPLDVEREPNTAVVLSNNIKALGGLGILQYALNNPEIKISIYTQYPESAEELRKATNVEIKNAVEPEKIPEVLSRTEKLLHLSEHFKANDRVVFEAILCGAEPIISATIGAGSWTSEFDILNVKLLKKVLRRAPRIFWREVWEAVND